MTIHRAPDKNLNAFRGCSKKQMAQLALFAGRDRSYARIRYLVAFSPFLFPFLDTILDEELCESRNRRSARSDDGISIARAILRQSFLHHVADYFCAIWDRLAKNREPPRAIAGSSRGLNGVSVRIRKKKHPFPRRRRIYINCRAFPGASR